MRQSMDERHTLPITLQVLKDAMDVMMDGRQFVPDPEYDFNASISELLGEGLRADEILVLRCPACGEVTYYNGGFTASCECCGYYNLADLSEEAVTLADWWGDS